MNLEIDYLWSHKCPKKWDQYTLIALVITIIVLLILAGVTVTTLTGDNGLLRKTQEAIEKNTEGEIKEQIRLIANEMKIQQAVSGESQENALRSILQSKDPNATVTKSGNIYEVFYNNNKFLMNSDLDYIPIVEPQNASDWSYTKSGVIRWYQGPNEETELVIPNYINGVRITKIEGFYAAGNPQKSRPIKISEGIEIIGANAFRTTNITGDLTIPDSVTEIENYAFQWDGFLNGKLKLGKNLTTIGNGAFQACACTGDLIIPDSVETVGESAFSNSKFNGKIKLGNNLKTIGDNAFTGLNNLTGDLIIPDSVTHVGKSAFYYCNHLDGIFKIGKNVERIEELAFGGLNTLLQSKDFVIPEKVAYIGNDAFYGAKKEITVLNRNVEIYGSANTLGNPSKIIGYANSTAKSYADSYERTFVALDN